MRVRNRNREDEQRTEAGGEAGAPRTSSSTGEDVRNRARRLLELGDQTISQALSQNSEQFLAQNRQQGGQ